MKQRKLAMKIAQQNKLRSELIEKLTEKRTRKEALIASIRTEKDAEKLKELDEETEALEKEIEGLETEDGAIEELIKKLDKDLEEQQDTEAENGQEGEERMKDKNKVTEQRSAISSYIRSKGQVREGFKSSDGEAIIPVDTQTKPRKEVGGDGLDLGKLVRTVKVNHASGSYPILKKTKAVLSTVAELEKNPELAKPEFHNVDYKIETYRGAIPISQEAIDDTDQDLVGIVEEHVDQMSINTDNAKISAILKTFTKKPIKTVDEIKAVLNVDLDPAYNKTFILSQSFYQLVDTVKDNEGRYLFQESITSPSGYTFLNKPVYVAEDTLLGTASKATGFIGDLKEAVTKFDRKQIGVRWADHNIYGQYLQGGKRMDVKQVDKKSGFFLTADTLTVGPEKPAVTE